MAANHGQSLAMRILVVGGGGREHSLCWAISASPLCTKLYCAPGNAGIAQVAECIDVAAEDIAGQVALAKREKIDFVVVGPEVPLAMGLADRLAEAGIKVFGPSQKAAQLESSKGFTKELCKRHNIPTGAYERFTDADKAAAYIKAAGRADRREGRRPRRRQGRRRGRDGRAGDRGGARHAVGQPLRRGRRLGRDRGVPGRRGDELLRALSTASMSCR